MMHSLFVFPVLSLLFFGPAVAAFHNNNSMMRSIFLVPLLPLLLVEPVLGADVPPLNEPSVKMMDFNPTICNGRDNSRDQGLTIRIFAGTNPTAVEIEWEQEAEGGYQDSGTEVIQPADLHPFDGTYDFDAPFQVWCAKGKIVYRKNGSWIQTGLTQAKVTGRAKITWAHSTGAFSKTIEATPFTTKCECDGSCKGDPHITKWGGASYDFMGACDLVLLQNELINIHIRTKIIKDYSYIQHVAIQMGNDIFQVKKGKRHNQTHWLNDQEDISFPAALDSGYHIDFTLDDKNPNKPLHIYNIDLNEGKGEKIHIVSYKHLINVAIKKASSDLFHGSLGLMGSFDEAGTMLARDGTTIMEDTDQFAMEWQVRGDQDPVLLFPPSTERASLSASSSSPVYPEQCRMPTKEATAQRNLRKSKSFEAKAQKACASVAEPKERELCISDCVSTNDLEMALNYV